MAGQQNLRHTDIKQIWTMFDKSDSLSARFPLDIDVIIKKGEGFSLRKNDASTTVGILRGKDFGLPHDLLVKRFNYRGFFDFLIHKLFNNRAKRLWNISLKLYEKGLPVPKPLTYTHPTFKQRDAFYVSSVIEYADKLSTLYREGIVIKDRDLLQKLAQTIAEWHLQGAVHGDLKWPNILVQKRDGSYGFFLIDLDQSRLYAVPCIKGIKKDLKRFYRFGLEIGAEQWVEAEFFPEYIKCIPDAIKPGIDFADIRNKALKDWIRKGSKRL